MVVIAVVMIATILLVEDVRGFSAIFDVLILGVALAVAAVWVVIKHAYNLRHSFSLL